MNRPVFLLVLLFAVLALALRWPAADRRPMHNDEAVNAVKFGKLWEGGGYKYDPNEHHGPSLYYASLALGRLTAAPALSAYTDARLRFVTVLFGVGLVLLMPLLYDGLGRRSVAWTALFTAASPALIFYSRYYIHEALLAFATFLALVAGWRYWRSRAWPWAVLAGVGLGLMHATKETFVLTLGAAAIALVINQTWNRLIDASGAPVKAPPLNGWHLLAGLAAWLLVAFLFFSSFFTNFAGVVDSVRTYMPWLQRAGGQSPHIHPWSFYLHRLLWFHTGSGPVWTEALIFSLALVAAWAAFARKRLGRASASFVRFLALYTFLLTAFYSLLPYKTPWCLVSFWHGTVLLAGVGATVLVRSFRSRPVRWGIALVFVAGCGHLAWQSWLQHTSYAADRRNPYVYAQTSPDVFNLVAQVQKLAEASPENRNLLIKVMAPDGDYWPLPWYLRDFKRVGWWEEVPPDPYAPLMLVSASFRASLDEDKKHLMPRYFQLRPDVFFELYVEVGLWREYLARNPRPVEPD